MRKQHTRALLQSKPHLTNNHLQLARGYYSGDTAGRCYRATKHVTPDIRFFNAAGEPDTFVWDASLRSHFGSRHLGSSLDAQHLVETLLRGLLC